MPVCLNLLKRRILEFGSHCKYQCESRTEIHFIFFTSIHIHSHPFTLDFIHLISFHINSHSISYLFTLSSQSISFRFTTLSQSNSHSISYLFTFHFISFHTPFHKCISHLFTIRCFSFHIFSQFTFFHFISFHRVREKIWKDVKRYEMTPLSESLLSTGTSRDGDQDPTARPPSTCL